MTKPFDTRDVKLLVPTGGKADRFGAQVTEYIEETVAGVLPQPGGTSDLGAERPNGRKVDMTFHWPRGHARSLAGCIVEFDGRRYRVIGDPAPYIDGNTPGPFDRTVETEAVDG
ncbi:hypothetical protein [Collinsella tanakaei]|jgi:hypothetical protein|uniref:Head-tail adaptor protein n=1 Tax=Collinsella tanakaei TaxID=626935 RepID=A0A3E4QYU8_9ACTN|nr:hypothetical protein [Collinsella tanakaei]RGL12345.1 hypothetical protein DXC81_01435 [Collinsella tanakaei]